MLSFSAACAFRTTPDSMNQNPPFPTPEELQTKLSEFMKSNFGDKVSFATFTQPERAEEGDDGKTGPPDRTTISFSISCRATSKRISTVS